MTLSKCHIVVTDLLQAVILWKCPCISIAVNGDLHSCSLTHDIVCHDDDEISVKSAPTRDFDFIFFTLTECYFIYFLIRMERKDRPLTYNDASVSG